MKPYKTIDKNVEVMEAVKTAKEYFAMHPSVSRKYLSNDEFMLDMAHICNASYGVAKRVAWFVRADGARDAEALKEWGFNQYKIPAMYIGTRNLDGEPKYWGLSDIKEAVDWWHSEGFDGPSNDDKLLGAYFCGEEIDIPPTFGELMEEFEAELEKNKEM